MKQIVASFTVALALTAVVSVSGHGVELPPPDFDWRSPTVMAQQEKDLAAVFQRVADYHKTVAGGVPRPAPPVGSPASNATCGACQAAGAAAVKYLHNRTNADKARADIAAECRQIFASKFLDDVICDVLGDAVIYAAEDLTYRLNMDVPNIVCADLLQQCVEPCCSVTAPFQPEQIHLSFNGEHDAVGARTSMRAAWATLKATGESTTHVWWRAASSTAWQTSAVADRRTYTLGGWTGMLYSAVMTDLLPDTTYQYYVGDATAGTSPVFNFTTLPLNAGTPERPLRVLGLADMGFGENGQPTIERMTELVEAGEIDFIVHPGDIGYADGNQMWWDTFFREMEPIMSRVAYMTGPGNHECVFWNCTAYRKRFWMPTATWPATGAALPEGTQFYRIYAGPLVFYMLDTESAFDTPQVTDLQTEWLAEALAQDTAATADRQRLIFATHHRPIYCDHGFDDIKQTQCFDYGLYLRAKLEGLYDKYGVSAVMCGHLHNYQRTLPIANGTKMASTYVNISSPMYLVNGGAGNREGNSSPQNEPDQASWAAFETNQRTFMVYEVFQSGTAEVTMRAKTIRSTTNVVIDGFNMTKHLP